MNSDERQFFAENGFLILRNVLSGEALKRLAAEIDDVVWRVETRQWRGNHLFETNELARVVFNPYDFAPTLRELVGRPDMVERAREMLGCPVQLHHTKIMCKVAAAGSPQPPHQDYYYWPDSKANQVAVFLCLNPSTEANGCLRVYPGSHRLGLLEHHKEFHEATGERHWVCNVPDVMRQTEVAFLGEPGDAIFFGSLTVHRSDGNNSERSRRAVIWEYDELGNLTPPPGWGAPMPAVAWE